MQHATLETEKNNIGAPERMGAKGNIIKTSTLCKNINNTCSKDQSIHK